MRLTTLAMLIVMLILSAACTSAPTMPISPTSTAVEHITNTAEPTPTITATATATTTQTPTVTVEPSATPTEEPTATTAATPTTSPQVKGLGLTRTDAARMFMLLEFNFELGINDEGREVFVGTISDGLATVTILGPENDVSSVFVEIRLPKPPTQNQSARTLAYLTTLLVVAAEDWEDGNDWLSASLNNMGESQTTFDNRDIVLVVTPSDTYTDVLFRISAR